MVHGHALRQFAVQVTPKGKVARHHVLHPALVPTYLGITLIGGISTDQAFADPCGFGHYPLIDTLGDFHIPKRNLVCRGP
jgi:hypothetical protein